MTTGAPADGIVGAAATLLDLEATAAGALLTRSKQVAHNDHEALASATAPHSRDGSRWCEPSRSSAVYLTR